MIFRDDTPFNSWDTTVSREGDIDDSVALLPYQRSILLIMLSILSEQPEIFFNDLEDIDADDMEDKLDDLMSRLSF